MFGSLAPAPPRTLGRTMMFFIPDGKYSLQVFSLDDPADGTIVACCEDVLAAAVKAKLVTPQAGQPHKHFVLGTPQAIQIEQLDGKTENVPPHCNSMTGWNRRAIKITMPANVSAEQTEAVAVICTLSATALAGIRRPRCRRTLPNLRRPGCPRAEIR